MKRTLLLLTCAFVFLNSEKLAAQCATADTISLHILSGIVNPTNTELTYDSVLVGQSTLESIAVTNVSGSRPRIVRITIADTTHPNPEFFLTSGKLSVDTSILLIPHASLFFPVRFNPTVAGWDTATIQFTWDSAGVNKIYSTNRIIGFGIAVNAVNSSNPSGVSYSIFPNPADNSLTIQSTSDVQNAECIIFDELGRVVFRRARLSSAADSDGKVTLDISRLPSGVYYARILGTNGTSMNGRLEIHH